MKLLMYGVSKETVMQEDVEKYQLSNEKKKTQMNDILKFDGVEEIVVLVNDFRNEYYLYVNESTFSHGDFLRYLAEKTDKTLQDIILETYSKFNEDVLRHLYEIASGYLSKPIGSFDTLESVEKAINYASELNTSGQILVKLFNEAIELAYSLKLQDDIQPLNNSRISKYIYLLKEKMGTLEKKNYILSGDDFQVSILSKILLVAGAQTITIIHDEETESQRQLNQVKSTLDELEAIKVQIAAAKSLHYRLSKTDAAILDLTQLSILDEETQEEVSSIRQTKKIQYLIDTGAHPIEQIENDVLDVRVIDPNEKLTFNDEERNRAIIAFDEILSIHIEHFMEFLEGLHNESMKQVTF